MSLGARRGQTGVGEIDAAELDELGRSLAGTVLRPGDSEYDAARRCFNALVDRRPAVIARCDGPGDVATAFDYARTHDLEVAVRGGGHNPAGHCVADGVLVIDLTRLRSVDVDPDRGSRARAEARPGSTSTRRRKRTASSRPAASSAPRVCAASPSAAASAT